MYEDVVTVITNHRLQSKKVEHTTIQSILPCHFKISIDYKFSRYEDSLRRDVREGSSGGYKPNDPYPPAPEEAYRPKPEGQFESNQFETTAADQNQLVKAGMNLPTPSSHQNHFRRPRLLI